MTVPLSIPSPSAAWQYFDVIAWINTTFGASLGGSLRIHAYALCILLGIVVAGVITHRRLNARGAERGIVVDVMLPTVILGIVGGRLFHVVTHPGDYFAGQSPFEIVAVWNGGLAIFGALLGGALGVWLGCRWTGLRFSVFADALAPGLLVAQAFGRLGNWFNHELFGWPTDLPWGLEIESSNPAYPTGLPAGTLFHPTFLYEILWLLAGALVLVAVERRVRLQWGKAIGFYFIWYGAGRAVFETIRVDPSLLFLGVRTNVWAALAAVVLGVVVVLVATRRHTGVVPSPYVPGRGPRGEDPEVHSEDTYAEHDESDLAVAAPGDAQVHDRTATTRD